MSKNIFLRSQISCCENIKLTFQLVEIPREFTIFMCMHNHFFAALSTAPDSQYTTNYHGGGLRALKLSVLQINFLRSSRRRLEEP